MIRLDRVSKRLGASLILDDVTLTIPRGSFTALLGASGSGKTTLLRIVAGLEQADTGAVFLDGKPALGLAPGQRALGYVAQGYALFAHMTVARNIAFGLLVRRPRPPRREIAQTVARLLGMVRLEGLGDRLPEQLSGGQRQRVALARALAVQPRVLLLDEPFGALDRAVRDALRLELRRLHDALAITTILVTHDQDEAVQLSDRVVQLERGRLVGEVTNASYAPQSPRRQARADCVALGAVPLG